MHSKNILMFNAVDMFHVKRAGEIKVQLAGGLSALILLSTTMKLKIKSQ